MALVGSKLPGSHIGDRSGEHFGCLTFRAGEGSGGLPGIAGDRVVPVEDSELPVAGQALPVRTGKVVLTWWALEDSNLRPQPCESDTGGLTG